MVPGCTRAARIRRASLTRGALLALAYAALGALVHAFGALDASSSGFWPGTGIGLAAALIHGPASIVWVVLGDMALLLGLGTPPELSLAHASTVAAEIALAWCVLARLSPIEARFERIRDVVTFVLGGVVLTTSLCLLSSVLMHRLLLAPGGRPDPTDAALWLGHGLGILAVTPALLCWHADRRPLLRTNELVVLVASCVAMLALAAASRPHTEPILLYAVFPLILWAALRFGPREVASVLMLAGGGAAMIAIRAAGPQASSPATLATTTLLLLVASFSGLLLAAALSERSAAARRTEDNERLYRAVLQQMAEGVVLLDDRGRLCHVSDRFCDIAGRSRDVLLGMRLDELVLDFDRERLAASLQGCHRGRSAYLEAELLRPPQQRLILSFSPRPLVGNEAFANATLIVVSDVTERRRAEEQARRQLQQLAHLSRLDALDQMASTIAHEISQPITAIGAYARAGQRRLGTIGNSDADLADALEGIANAARHGGEVLQRIRRLAGDHPLQIVEIEPGYLIAEITRLLEAEARQYGISLASDASLLRPRVRADAIQIQQVLLNLMHNGLEAIAESACPRRELRLSAHALDDARVEFRVRDSGPGIEVHDQQAIFEPFHTSKTGGTGIGLAISRSIAEAHGGELRVDSRPGCGATFRLLLPACPEAERIDHV